MIRNVWLDGTLRLYNNVYKYKNQKLLGLQIVFTSSFTTTGSDQEFSTALKSIFH